MDVRELHHLIAYLTDLARQVSVNPDEPPASLGEIAVVDDIVTNPGSSVRDITERTGFVQSHVSTTIARLSERGFVTTAADPADRRRTLAHPSDALLSLIEERASRTVHAALAKRLGDKASAARAGQLLDELARLLLE
ncbi:MarR family transcriptional regulator [Nocardia sp. NPDC003482]